MGLKGKEPHLFLLRNLEKFLGAKKEQRKLIIKNVFRYREFTEMSNTCYQILRKNSDVIVTLLRMMLCCGIPELSEKSISNLKYIIHLLKYKRIFRNFSRAKFRQKAITKIFK